MFFVILFGIHYFATCVSITLKKDCPKKRIAELLGERETLSENGRRDSSYTIMNIEYKYL